MENAVQQVERWVLAPLRNRTLSSVQESDLAIAERLEWLDMRVMKGCGLSRRALFEQLDRLEMQALEVPRYQFARWKNAKVAHGYCVEFEGRSYSVPITLVGRGVELRVTPLRLVGNTWAECCRLVR